MKPDSPWRWHRAVVAVRREEHEMQWSRGLAHWVTPVMTLSYWNPLWARCLLYPSVKPSVLPGEPGCSCSVPSSEKQTQGLLLAKTTRGKDWGVGRGRETEEKTLILCTLCWYLCAGEQPVPGFVHVKPTADPILCLWACQLTASWLATGWKEAPASHCYPCLLPLLYQLTHYESGKPLLYWVTPSLEAFILVRGPLTKCILSMWCSKLMDFQARWELLKKIQQAAHILNFSASLYPEVIHLLTKGTSIVVFCFQFWRSASEWIAILYQALVSVKSVLLPQINPIKFN